MVTFGKGSSMFTKGNDNVMTECNVETTHLLTVCEQTPVSQSLPPLESACQILWTQLTVTHQVSHTELK
jgi:hypothetical protein